MLGTTTQTSSILTAVAKRSSANKEGSSLSPLQTSVEYQQPASRRKSEGVER
jgi:hypothetical protein